MDKIDICILTAGRFDLLEKCLDSVEQVTKNTPCNVYVFDNGSPSDDRQAAADLFRRPIITRHRRSSNNTGFPGGANAAIRMGKSPLVLFVSDDIVLTDGAIESLVSTMQDKKIGMCGLKLLFADGSTSGPAGKVQHIGHAVDLDGNIIHPLIGWSANNPRCCISREVFSVTGAVFMVRRALFERVRGFNTAYGAGYYEDVELALQITGLGYKIWVDCNAIAYHFVGATFSHKKQPPMLDRNRQIFLSNNRGRLVWTDWIMR